MDGKKGKISVTTSGPGQKLPLKGAASSPSSTVGITPAPMLQESTPKTESSVLVKAPLSIATILKELAGDIQYMKKKLSEDSVSRGGSAPDYEITSDKVSEKLREKLREKLSELSTKEDLKVLLSKEEQVITQKLEELNKSIRATPQSTSVTSIGVEERLTTALNKLDQLNKLEDLSKLLNIINEKLTSSKVSNEEQLVKVLSNIDSKVPDKEQLAKVLSNIDSKVPDKEQLEKVLSNIDEKLTSSKSKEKSIEEIRQSLTEIKDLIQPLSKTSMEEKLDNLSKSIHKLEETYKDKPPSSSEPKEDISKKLEELNESHKNSSKLLSEIEKRLSNLNQESTQMQSQLISKIDALNAELSAIKTSTEQLTSNTKSLETVSKKISNVDANLEQLLKWAGSMTHVINSISSAILPKSTPPQ